MVMIMIMMMMMTRFNAVSQNSPESCKMQENLLRSHQNCTRISTYHSRTIYLSRTIIMSGECTWTVAIFLICFHYVLFSIVRG